MRRLTAVAVLALATATFAALAGPALAARKVLPASTGVGFDLKGSHGFQISVTTEGQQVSLTASKGGEAADYTVRGKVSRRALSANFGQFGRISVRFAEEHRGIDRLGALLTKGCKGPKPIEETGSFRGTIKFRGENAFSTANARSAKGSVHRQAKLVCPPEPEGGEEPERGETAVLVAESHADGREVSFVGGALTEGKFSFSFISAGSAEKIGPVKVLRTGIELGNAGAVLFSAPGVHPETATVNAPPPLHGTASYTENPGAAPTWTGPLSVTLVGGETVPLTGPDFQARICRKLSELPCGPAGAQPPSAPSSLTSSARAGVFGRPLS